MDSKTFRSILKTKKGRIAKLALRSVIPLEVDEDAEEALIAQIVDLKADLQEDELNSQEMDDLLEAVASEDFTSLRKYLPAQTSIVGDLLYGASTPAFVRSARAAIIACLAHNKSDVSFFLNKKMLKRGISAAQKALEAEAPAVAPQADDDEEPGQAPAPAATATAEAPAAATKKKAAADDVLGKIKTLLADQE